jgi:hypothetical protein
MQQGIDALHVGIGGFEDSGRSFEELFTAVGAGAGLFLALRFALADPAQTGPIALFLMIALVAHLFDLRARWSSRP